jgi:hypothetical protein
MKGIFLYMALVVLGGHFAYGQISCDNGLLRIGSKFQSSDLNSIELDSIIHLCFTDSKLESLDSSFHGFRNVKIVTFQQNSIIPQQMDILTRAETIHFVKYTKPILFPEDFPFGKWHQIFLSVVKEIPYELNKFYQANSLFLYEIMRGSSCCVIDEMINLNVLSICEVSELDMSCYCQLDNLETIEISSCKFIRPFVDLRCFKTLENFIVESTNLEALAMNTEIIRRVVARDNALSPLEQKKLMDLSPKINLEISQ